MSELGGWHLHEKEQSLIACWLAHPKNLKHLVGLVTHLLAKILHRVPDNPIRICNRYPKQ